MNYRQFQVVRLMKHRFHRNESLLLHQAGHLKQTVPGFPNSLVQISKLVFSSAGNLESEADRGLIKKSVGDAIKSLNRACSVF